MISPKNLPKGLDVVNQLKERGVVQFSRRDSARHGDVTVTLTDNVYATSDASATHSGQASSIATADSYCGSGGKNDYEFKMVSVPPKHNFYLNDQTTEEVIEIALYGAGAAGALTAILSATGAGTVPAVVSGVLTAFLSAAAGLMSTENEGDGIIIRVNITSPTSGYVEVDSQCEGYGGIPW